MFLSGFGLCYSYKQNTLLKFYLNRIKRICPTYFISVCMSHLIHYSFSNLFILLLNLTTIGYYIDYGYNRFDWYLESLFLLYLAYPLLFLYSKLKYVGLLLLFASIAILCHYIDIYWWYDCLIARLPILLLGILFYQYVMIRKNYKLLSLIGILLYIPCKLYSSQFLAGSLLAIPIILLMLNIKEKLSEKICLAVEFCGKHSLNLYCANVLVYSVLKEFQPAIFHKVWLYVILQIVFSFLMGAISQKIEKLYSIASSAKSA